MSVLSTPVVLRMILALFLSGLACLVTVVVFRRLRRSFTAAEPMEDTHPEPEQFPLHAYNAVIQELKQQKHELVSAQQAEKRRAKTSENINVAVLSHISSGVMFLTPNGIVRQANAAAKHILGFASLAGMAANDVFRDVSLTSDNGSTQDFATVLEANLLEKLPSRTWQALYVTPSGGRRVIEITLTAVCSGSGEVLGAACLITDKTEMAQIQKQQQLRGEISAEMALELRGSVAAISGYARQLVADQDPDRTQQLAADIISEAAQLDHTLGGFLTGTKAVSRAAGA